MGFEYLVPTKIVFGNRRLQNIGEISKIYGKRALIITGKSAMKEQGYLERVINSLNDSGIESRAFNKISPNPKSNEIDKALELVKNYSPDLLIGLGGGSAIDAAKAISIGIDYDSIDQVIGKNLPITHNHIPVIAIPTTAGSGAEVTKGAIITDIKKGFKSGIRGECLFPKIALIDPELTLSLPKKITIQTGFDALTHSIESYIAKKSNPITDMYAERALGLIANNLQDAINHPESVHARKNMSYASLLGGMNIANASSCLPHRLQQAMGSVIEISHGQGLAAVYPKWLEIEQHYSKKKFKKIAEIFHKSTGVQGITDFMKEIGVYCKISQFTKDKKDIDKFLDKVSGNVTNDPIENIDKNLMKEIYEKSF